jgi:ribonucleoside-diphosphate reductase subunit M2
MELLDILNEQPIIGNINVPADDVSIGVDVKSIEIRSSSGSTDESLADVDIIFFNDIDIVKPEADIEEYLEPYKRYADDFGTSIVSEPILSESASRFTVFPIQYPTIYQNYKHQQQINWVPEEVDFAADVKHWREKLSKNDRTFLCHVLAFFAAFDGIVNLNIRSNLIDVVKIKEAEMGYGKQFDMENVHGENYSIMIDTFVKDPTLKDKLINSIKTMPSVKRKADWCKKWIESDKTYAHKLVAFAIVEAVFFSGAFASIFWLKTRPGSIMPGLRKANKFIARDENLHVELACLLYALLKNRLRQDVVYEIFREAVEIEDEFINASLPCKMLGMNSILMSKYVKYVADRLLVQLGYEKLYSEDNPFDFMKKIDTFVKDNFFEGRVDSYTDSKIDNPKIYGEDVDF